ncbi:cytochrome b/b6 domain-containing protein [Litorivicinus sp.]|nr:cytochrome b/b6 domain-containing protein [Litorivicinus sp.]
MSRQPIERHAPPERLFHWTMAASVIICLATAFLPILGFEFDWVDPHWIAGVVLILAIIFHLWRVFFRLELKEMSVTKTDLTDLKAIIDPTLKSDETDRKYDLGQKLYHLATAALIISLCLTGGLMLAKLDTWFWDRIPGILSDAQWGIVYTVHGATALCLIMMFILHLYFSFLPEHRQLLIAMASGNPNLKKGTHNE